MAGSASGRLLRAFRGRVAKDTKAAGRQLHAQAAVVAKGLAIGAEDSGLRRAAWAGEGEGELRESDSLHTWHVVMRACPQQHKGLQQLLPRDVRPQDVELPHAVVQA